MEPLDEDDRRFLREAIALAREALDDDAGGPFGAVVVSDGRVVGRGRNRVLADRDPTAHAEIVALRDAAARLGTHVLSGATAYASCEPCPMCLAALRWARVDRLVFAADREDAAAIGFDDARFHAESQAGAALSATQLLRPEAREMMRAWGRRPDRRLY